MSSEPNSSAALCAWCEDPLPEESPTGRRRRRDAVTCSKTCRQRRQRWKVTRAEFEAASVPMRFAYADPPYPGRAELYDEKREVDHRELIDRLVEEFPDGWALSTASDCLREVLPLCPADVRVCSWTRRPRPTRSRRPLSSWEPLIVSGGRIYELDATLRVTDAIVDRSRYNSFPGALVGMKPPAFAEWMFKQLGARPGDELADVFPGSGAIGKAWSLYAAVE